METRRKCSCRALLVGGGCGGQQDPIGFDFLSSVDDLLREVTSGYLLLKARESAEVSLSGDGVELLNGDVNLFAKIEEWFLFFFFLV